MLSDAPIEHFEQDHFEFESLVSTLVNHIGDTPRSESELFGVFGPWGSGKSSLLKLAKARTAECLVWVDFDALRYQAHGNVLLPLLHEVARQLGKPRSLSEKSTAVIRSIALSLQRTFLPYIPYSDLATGAIDGFTDIAKELSGRDPAASLPDSPATLMRCCFKELVEQFRENDQKHRVVVAVDNLDRCQPAGVLATIEALHLVLNVPGCTFLVAVDQDALIRFVNSRYEGTGFEGARYLEKVFPDYVRVPEPWALERYDRSGADPDPIQRFLKELLADSRCDHIRPYEEVIWTISAYSQAMRNPRRIKRVIRRLASVAAEDMTSDNIAALVFLAALSDVWPEVYSYLRVSEPTEWGDFVRSTLPTGRGKPLAERSQWAPAVSPEFVEFTMTIVGSKVFGREISERDYACSRISKQEDLFELLGCLRRTGI